MVRVLMLASTMLIGCGSVQLPYLVGQPHSLAEEELPLLEGRFATNDGEVDLNHLGNGLYSCRIEQNGELEDRVPDQVFFQLSLHREVPYFNVQGENEHFAPYLAFATTTGYIIVWPARVSIFAQAIETGDLEGIIRENPKKRENGENQLGSLLTRIAAENDNNDFDHRHIRITSPKEDFLAFLDRHEAYKLFEARLPFLLGPALPPKASPAPEGRKTKHRARRRPLRR